LEARDPPETSQHRGDIVEVYKNLGIHIDYKMDWTKNTEALWKKGQSCLYFIPVTPFQKRKGDSQCVSSLLGKLENLRKSWG